MAGSKVIEYIISARDKTGAAISSATGKIKQMASAVGSQLMNIKAGFDMMMGVARTFASAFATAIKEAFKFETAVANFKTLLGSVDEAKAHIADLKSFAASTPLTFDDLSRASKLLLSFGASIDTVVPSLKTLGDIAMGDAQKFQGLALVFAQVQSQGKLMGQDLLQMVNQGFNPLTIIAEATGKSVAELKDLMGEGAISFEMVAEAMRIATSEGGRFHGAMEECSKTGEGLMSTLQDNWTEAVRTFGEAFSDASKSGLQQLIDKLSELNENGTIEEWAKNVAHWFSAVVDGAKAVIGVFSTIYKYSGLADAVNLAQGMGKGAWDAVGGAVGAIAGGGGIGDAWRSARENFDSAVTRELAEDGFWLKDANEAFGRKRGWIVDKPTAKKKAKKEATSKPSETPAPAKSLSDMLADATADADAKAAEKAEKERLKALKEEAAERLRIEKEIARERDRLQKLEAQNYERALRNAIKAAQEDLANAQNEQTLAENALAEAQSKVEQAWGWYRDKDSLKAQIEEEKAEAAARKQFDKDFEKLKDRRRDWRTADNLSLDDEAVRRVGLAMEEEKAALEYAKQTAENTKDLATVLEQLVEMKEN